MAAFYKSTKLSNFNDKRFEKSLMDSKTGYLWKHIEAHRSFSKMKSFVIKTVLVKQICRL